MLNYPSSVCFGSSRVAAVAIIAGAVSLQALLGSANAQATSGRREARPIPAERAPVDQRSSAASAVVGRGDAKLSPEQALVRQAIAAATVTRGGKSFPAPTQSGGRSTGASCQLYETRAFTQQAPIHIEGAKRVKKTVTFPPGAPQLSVYSPTNTDWVINSYNQVIDSAGSAYTANVSGVPAGYSGGTSVDYSFVSSTMDSYVTNLAILEYIKFDLDKQIESFVSNVMSYNASINSSHGAVHHTAQVYGTGVVNTSAAHSWYHGWVNGTETCAPAYLRSQNALVNYLQSWVNGVVATIPVAVRVGDHQQK